MDRAAGDDGEGRGDEETIVNDKGSVDRDLAFALFNEDEVFFTLLEGAAREVTFFALLEAPAVSRKASASLDVTFFFFFFCRSPHVSSKLSSWQINNFLFLFI